MGNRVYLLFFMMIALSFLFSVFSSLYLERRKKCSVVCHSLVWISLLAVLLVPMCDFFGIVNLKLFRNFTGGMRCEIISVLSGETLTSDLFIPKKVLEFTRSVFLCAVILRLASSAAYFTYSIAGYFNNLHFLTKQSEECHDDKIKLIFERAKRKAGLRRAISLRVMDKGIRLSPCTCGINFPAVYIGKEILYDYTEERLELVFLHELTHIRNHDTALKLFALFVKSLFYGLPGADEISEAITEDAEYRCDAAVLSMSGEERLGAYVSMIIDVAERNLKNDYRGYDFLSPVSRSGELIIKRYKFLKEHGERKNSFIVMFPLIIIAAAANIFILSAVSVTNIDNLGIDLANPGLETAVCGYFGITDPHDISEREINSVYSIEFMLADDLENMSDQDTPSYAVTVRLNEGLSAEGDSLFSENPGVHYIDSKMIDTRDIDLFSNLRTLIFSDKLRAAEEDVYASEKFAVITRDE